MLPLARCWLGSSAHSEGVCSWPLSSECAKPFVTTVGGGVLKASVLSKVKLLWLGFFVSSKIGFGSPGVGQRRMGLYMEQGKAAVGV